MNRLFTPKGFITVPDGTDVSAFLNATDTSQQDVPWGALSDMSIAAGRIGPGVISWIHVHPAVTQVTYLVSGSLGIRMRDRVWVEPYDLTMHPGSAVLVEPGTLFQLRNTSDQVAEVLYIVSPTYAFEMVDDKVVHDDAMLVARTWEELETAPLAVDAYEAVASRAESLRRLARSKGAQSAPILAEQSPKVLSSQKDYLAPDGSEIRLLADGPRGGVAHCMLPAGSVGAAVRHRTVDELWYVLEGEGDLWRSRDGHERVDPLLPGSSVHISVGTSFQFRALEGGNLKILIATMPPWPGAREAVAVPGKWPVAL